MTLVEKRVNQKVRMRDAMETLTGHRPFLNTILCPFHYDQRKSAKVYEDLDGDRIFCFSGCGQKTVSEYLRHMGQDLAKWDPGGELVESMKKELDYSPLDGFIKGEFGMEEFCRRMIRLEAVE